MSEVLQAPKSNEEYWSRKIENNQKRDQRQRKELRREGWHVVRVWEHELKGDTELVIRKLRKFL